MHISVPIADTMEYINATRVSPLISHVQVKVCYVGQQPNRNGTIITKEVATKFGENLPGCPIVGYYNEQTKDFEGHNRELVVEDNKFRIVDTTKPYGFVPTDAKVWFQTFSDEGVEHEYLCTEGYIWTGIYKESQRVADKGNNQSMELNKEYEKGFWTKDKNSGRDIFIISDGLIEKLCILGSDVEPCFEGSQIKSFSLMESEFKATMFSMIQELKDALKKGGSEGVMENEKDNVILEEETPASEFEKKKEEEKKEEAPAQEKEEQNEEPKDEGSEEEDDKKKKKEYECVEDIPEYVALKNQYDELQSKYSALEQQNQVMSEEIESLRSFKLSAERKDKEAMIASFYMLSDEEKKDVVDHIDTYSLDDIESKLCVICVRNKVDFKQLEEEKESTQNYTLNLISNESNGEDDAPEWVKAVRRNSNQ